MELRILFVWQGILTCVSVVRAQTYTDETDLRANLSTGYNRFVRPSTPTNVTVYYNVRALQGLDITAQEMALTGWMTLSWSDPRFVWDSSKSGINQLEVDWGWRPEFVISNSASMFVFLGMSNGNTRLRVYNGGHVRWNQLLCTATSCDVDITNFPFDTQTCELEVIFWGYDDDEVNLVSQFTEARSEMFLENAEWMLQSSSTETEYVPLCCPNTQGPLLRISLTFARRRQFYVMSLIFPTVLLSLTMVWVFLLPTDSGERLGYALTILLAYTVQMSITAQMMPTTSKQVPHIAQYLLIVLVMCSLVTCNVVLHVKLFYLEGPVYGWLKAVYRKVHPVLFMTCCTKKKKQQPDNKVVDIHINRDKSNSHIRKKTLPKEDIASDDKNEEEDREEVTWAKVSILMDRICFLMYAIAVATVNGMFLNSIAG